MATVALIDLTADEYAGLRPDLVSGYAQSMAANYGIPPAEAHAEAERQTAALLPDGVDTPGQLLRKGMVDDVEVGLLWIALSGAPYPAMAWVYEIEVRPGHRSRGYGSAMLLAGEADLADRGVRRVGLHVFGANTGARRLYRRLGYRMLAQLRARSVAPASSPVTLVPMTQAEYEQRLAHLIATDPAALTRDPLSPPSRARDVATVLAPQGVAGDNVLLCHAVAGGRPVGWIWLSLPGAQRPDTGTIHYLTIDEPWRRRGHGRALLAAAEAEYARRGVPRMGLWIAASSSGAEQFADRLGLEVSSEHMVKDL